MLGVLLSFFRCLSEEGKKRFVFGKILLHLHSTYPDLCDSNDCCTYIALQGASNFGDQRVYLEYLDSELEHRNVEIRRLKDEIRTKVLQTMNESEKLRKVQRSIHDSNLRNEQLMMTNMELK